MCVCVSVCVYVCVVCECSVCGVCVCVCGVSVCVCVCGVRVCVCGVCGVCVCVVFLFFIYLLTFIMLHYKVILHALQLNIHNTITYIYNYVQFPPFSIITAGLLSVF